MMRAVRLQQFDRIVETEPFADAQGQLAFALQVLVNQKRLPTGIVLRRGDAPTGGVGDGKFGGAAKTRGSWRRNFRLDQPSRGFAQNAGRIARGVVVDFAAFGSLRLRCNSSELQGCGVGHGDVFIHPDEHSGMRAGHRVYVLVGRQLSVCPQRLVPATADEPLTGRGVLDAGGDALLHLGQRVHAAQIDAQQIQSRVLEMNVSIIEARHHEVAAEIDNLRVRSPLVCRFRHLSRRQECGHREWRSPARALASPGCRYRH